MATIESLEDIQAWTVARQLNAEIYRITRLGGFARDFALRDQIRRASLSIMLNIAEGFERGGNAEFRQFLAIAKGSSGEVRSALYAALDAEFIDHVQFQTLSDLTKHVSRLISGFIRYLSNTEKRGHKFRPDDNDST